MDIEDIINSNVRKVFFLYYEDFYTPYKNRAWQIVFNRGDCDLFMVKDTYTSFKYNYEGINYLGEFVFDEIPKNEKSCCFTKKGQSRNRLLFVKRPMEMFATHIDKFNGKRTQYMVAK